MLVVCYSENKNPQNPKGNPEPHDQRYPWLCHCQANNGSGGKINHMVDVTN